MPALPHWIPLVAIAATARPAVAQSCPEPEAHAFDFWIGDWNVNNRYLVEGVWRDIGSAEVQVFPVAGGCGIVELWDGMMGRGRVRGFSLRTWNPDDSTWTLVLNWPQPGRASFSTLRGAFRHGRGDFFSEAQTPDGPRLTRYTFSDIRPDAFRWNDGASSDSGRTWRTQWIMEYGRRPADARPVVNAALANAVADPICSGDAFEGPRRLLGRWRSTDGASLVAVRAIGGCAVLLFLEWPTDGAPRELFAVLGYDSRAAHWTAWILSTAQRGFVELSGGRPTALVGDGGAFHWTARTDTRLDVEWTDPAGVTTTLELGRPGT